MAPDGEHRPGLQRRQAVHRHRRRSTTTFVERLHGGDGGPDPRRPVRPGDVATARSRREAAAADLHRAGRRTPSTRARPSAPAARGPTGPGAFVEATVLTDVTPEMRAFREELFGPVAVVYKVQRRRRGRRARQRHPVRPRRRGLPHRPGERPRRRQPARRRHGRGSTRPRAAAPSCRSAAPSAPASAASSARTASTSSSNRKLIHVPAGG